MSTNLFAQGKYSTLLAHGCRGTRRKVRLATRREFGRGVSLVRVSSCCSIINKELNMFRLMRMNRLWAMGVVGMLLAGLATGAAAISLDPIKDRGFIRIAVANEKPYGYIDDERSEE